MIETPEATESIGTVSRREKKGGIIQQGKNRERKKGGGIHLSNFIQGKKWKLESMEGIS